MSTEKITSDESTYEIYVREAIEAGLSDSQAERTVDVTVVRERFGLPS